MELLVNNILTRGFWGDEAWTALISQLPWPDLVKTTAADFHPPLYYSIIHFWILAFGSGEVTIRLVSLVFWMLAGLVAYLFARTLKLSLSLSLVATLFVLFNPFIFQFAFEARNYTLFVFLSMASMWQFHKLTKIHRTGSEIRRNGFAYILLTTLGLYTHYYMFFVVMAQYLFILLFRRDLWKRFLLFSFLFFLLYLPWLPFFFSQAKSVAGGYWIGPIGLGTIAGGALVLFLGEQRTPLTYVLPLLFFFYFVSGWQVVAKAKKLLTPETALFVFWIVIPFVTPLLISLVRPIFFYRYLVFISAPVMLLPLYWLAAEKKLDKIFLVLPGIILLSYLFTDTVSFLTNTDQHFKPILAKIHQEAKKGDTLYTLLPSFAEVVYYNNSDGQPLPVKVVPVGLAQASGKALLDTYVQKGYLTLENRPKQGRYWYLEPGPKYKLVISH